MSDAQQPGPENRPENRPNVEEPKSEGPSSKGPSWIGGVVLILIGALLLLHNVGGITIDNWWALFILIPAAGSFAGAWNAYRKSGNRVTGSVKGSIIGGVVLTTISVLFLFNLDWGKMWPVFIIIAGLATLVGALK